jgi:hypothetical protein
MVKGFAGFAKRQDESEKRNGCMAHTMVTGGAKKKKKEHVLVNRLSN